jgi:cytochrome c biogenesis protein CcmG/thiol:disulfide interchange protein DsbE
MRRLYYILPVAALLLLAAVFAALLVRPRDPGEVPSPFVGKPVPAFSLPTLDGDGMVTDADLRGGVTVFNVFASWCLPCRAEHPILMRLARDGKARVIGLNYKDKPDAAKKWLAELGNPFARIARDEKGRTAIDYGVYGVPETFIIDAAGIIRYKHIGPIHANEFEERIAPVIERLLREGAKK